jgi:DNA-binding NtrC family response regulator
MAVSHCHFGIEMRSALWSFGLGQFLWVIFGTFRGMVPALAGQGTMNLLRDKCVLIIDDDTGMLRALEKVLTGEGWKVTCATLVGDAIEILAERKTPMDLVITDLRMPCVSGLTGLYGIHTLFPELPVIVLTAFGAPGLGAECLSHGAAAFLEKPLGASQLRAAIKAVLAPPPNEKWRTDEDAAQNVHSGN